MTSLHLLPTLAVVLVLFTVEDTIVAAQQADHLLGKESAATIVVEIVVVEGHEAQLAPAGRSLRYVHFSVDM